MNINDNRTSILTAMFVVAAVSGLLLAVPAATTTTSAQVFDDNGEKIIKIGAILSEGSSAHDDRLKAMGFAKDDFNAAQNEYRLEIVELRVSGESDSHADSRTGAKIKEAFDNQQLSYFVGPMGSTDTTSAKAQLALLEPANPNNDFIVISPASTALSLRADDSVFRMTIDDSNQAVEIANLLESDGKTHVVMIGLNSHHTEEDGTPERDIWSEGLESSFTTSYAGKGTINSHLTIAIYDDKENEPGPSAYDDFAENLNREVSGLIDSYGAHTVAVVIMGYGDDLFHLVNAINRDSTLDSLDDVKWYGPDGIATRPNLVGEDNVEVGSFLAKVGFVATQYAGEDNPTKSNVVSRLLASGVSSIDSIYLYSSYDAMLLLAHAIAERDSSGDTVKDLLLRLADEPVGTGALGDYSFGPNGDLDEPLSYKAWRIVLNENSVPGWTDDPYSTRTCR